MFHDTFLYKVRDQKDYYGSASKDPSVPSKVGVYTAVEDFLSSDNNWKKVLDVEYSCGLVILERIYNEENHTG